MAFLQVITAWTEKDLATRGKAFCTLFQCCELTTLHDAQLIDMIKKEV